jgi:hypothetical protein
LNIRITFDSGHVQRPSHAQEENHWLTKNVEAADPRRQTLASPLGTGANKFVAPSFCTNAIGGSGSVSRT